MGGKKYPGWFRDYLEVTDDTELGELSLYVYGQCSTVLLTVDIVKNLIEDLTVWVNKKEQE